MTRFIVVLGITSHSGKSTIVSALCRILKNRGLKVAPFKSQNMSLNSWVTPGGKEMGIAQAVQAWAAEAVRGRPGGRRPGHGPEKRDPKVVGLAPRDDR